jgi:hypothetical protein
MASWQKLISALWTRLSDSDIHNTGKVSPCAPLEEESDMRDRILGFSDTTMTLNREGQSSSSELRQTKAKFYPVPPTLSQFDDLDDSDDLIREAGLCLIEMELTEPYDDSVDFFSWRTNKASASEQKD